MACAIVSVILVVWEHVNIQYLTAALGVDPLDIPVWADSNYDSIYQLALEPTSGDLQSFAVFAQNFTYSPH
jgi:hypothetical protein